MIEPRAGPRPNPGLEVALTDAERVLDPLEAVTGEGRLQPRADARNLREPMGGEEGRLAAWGNDAHAGSAGPRTGLGALGGQLGHEAIGSAANGQGECSVVLDP